MKFISKAESMGLFGICCASQIPIFKRKGFKIPKGFKAAIEHDGVVYPAKGGERLHADIELRVGIWLEPCIQGFVYKLGR